MAHPFFDELRFPWPLPLAGELHQALYRTYTMVAGVRDVAVRSGVEPAKIAWDGASVFNVWIEVLNAATVAKRLLPLLDLVLADPGAGQIHTVVQRVKDARTRLADGTNVLDRWVLRGDQPFLDRAELRVKLRRMRDRSDVVPSVLLVRGKPKSGKSRSQALVRVLAEEEDDDVLYFDSGNATRVGTVVERLLTWLDEHKPVPASFTSDGAAYDDVCREAARRAKAKTKRLWIIVDELSPDAQGQPRVDPEVLRFFHQLARLMTSYPEEYAGYLRLVLIDYPSGLDYPPSTINLDALEDDTTVDLSREHVETFVAQFYRDTKRQFSTADVDAQATLLLARADVIANETPKLGRAGALRRALIDWLGKT